MDKFLKTFDCKLVSTLWLSFEEVQYSDLIALLEPSFILLLKGELKEDGLFGVVSALVGEELALARSIKASRPEAGASSGATGFPTGMEDTVLGTEL